MTRVLASVRSASEAMLALAGGADLIDAKDPSHGALGALEPKTIREIVAAVGGIRPVSATAGDLALDPRQIVSAAERIADTGVDLVKIGFFAGPERTACLPPLEPIAHRQPLVAVLFADQDPDLDLIARLAGAGFAGVMLDTSDKARGPLTIHADPALLAEFVGLARRHGLLTGLAGSLGLGDLEGLLSLGADYLGFRRALCADGNRRGDLDPARLRAVVAAVRAGFLPRPHARFASRP
jgi:uncharacterized protein (UPF0264 family)